MDFPTGLLLTFDVFVRACRQIFACVCFAPFSRRFHATYATCHATFHATFRATFSHHFFAPLSAPLFVTLFALLFPPLFMPSLRGYFISSVSWGLVGPFRGVIFELENFSVTSRFASWDSLGHLGPFWGLVGASRGQLGHSRAVWTSWLVFGNPTKTSTHLRGAILGPS